MRHQYYRKKLNRDSDHRRALFKNLIKSLVAKETIKTTESKAKAVRKIFEKLITKGKEGTLSARRLIHAFLQDRQVVNKMVDKLAPLFKERRGGFTRMIRLGRRKGDQAMLVKLELTAKTLVIKEPTKKKEKPVTQSTKKNNQETKKK